MSEIAKIAKVRVLDILDVYEDGQYLARVEEIPVVDSPIYEVLEDTQSFNVDTNGVLINDDVIPKNVSLKLLACKLGEYLSPFKYEYVDAEGNLQHKVVYLTSVNLKHVSGALGTKVN